MEPSVAVHPHASFWLDAADKVLKLLAVIVGAAWAWTQISRSRLEPTVSAEIFTKGGAPYLLIFCRLKNVVSSKYTLYSTYTIQQRGTACEVIAISLAGRNRLATLPIFEEHGWITPEGEIEESIVLPIPNPQTFIALQIRLRIVTNGIEWNGSCIVKSPDAVPAAAAAPASAPAPAPTPAATTTS